MASNIEGSKLYTGLMIVLGSLLIAAVIAIGVLSVKLVNHPAGQYDYREYEHKVDSLNLLIGLNDKLIFDKQITIDSLSYLTDSLTTLADSLATRTFELNKSRVKLKQLYKQQLDETISLINTSSEYADSLRSKWFNR